MVKKRCPARAQRANTPPMYATGNHVCYLSCSRGVPLLAPVVGPSPSGPEFLNIQYRGAVNIADHTAAKLCRLEAARV